MKSRGYTAQLCFLIDEESKIGEARRAAQALALYEFDQTVAGRVAIVATELATNLLRHAQNGRVLIQTLGEEDEVCIEILAIDAGPGMADVNRCMVDGYSTSGTAGQGLGAVRRLSDDFDIYSSTETGTVVMARVGKGPKTRFGAVNIPTHGEVDCGDAWHLTTDGTRTAVIVADGLGHGTLAAEAAQAAVGAFMAGPFDPPLEIMQRASRIMSKTRGGAAACALIDGEKVSYAGVGNISASLVGPEKSHGLVSGNGTLGMQMRRVQQFEYTLPPQGRLVMHSDGIATRWDLKRRPDLLACHPAIIAGALYREYERGNDDATIVVIAP